MNTKDFVIRVYGIYIDPAKGLLVSDERIQGSNITKLPGGGLEWGEGPVDCLKREMLEETGCAFHVKSHFYTTDFFVESVFNSSKQVISIYYRMIPSGDLSIPIQDSPFSFETQMDGAQSFRFIAKEDISPDVFTLVIDRHVALLLQEDH